MQHRISHRTNTGRGTVCPQSSFSFSFPSHLSQALQRQVSTTKAVKTLMLFPSISAGMSDDGCRPIKRAEHMRLCCPCEMGIQAEIPWQQVSSDRQRKRREALNPAGDLQRGDRYWICKIKSSRTEPAGQGFLLSDSLQ